MKEQTPLEKYLDENFPLTSKEFLGYYNDKRATFMEGYEFAKSEAALPPTPELQQMLDEKFPVLNIKEWTNAVNSCNYKRLEENVKNKVYRDIATEFYLAGQSSLKQESQNYKDLWKQGCEIIDALQSEIE